MTNHTRHSQGCLAALLLAGLSAACMSDPLAGTNSPEDAGVTPGAGTVATGGATGPAGGATTAAGGVTSPAGGATSASEAVTSAVGIFPVTSFTVLESPEREVDILFVIDNSPSMDPKQTALAANFPKMIQVLQNLPDPSDPSGTGVSLPDVHIGVISSDMGAGSDNIGGNCSRVLGDRGLLWGNDTYNPIASVAGPPNNGCGLNPGERWITDVANANGVGRSTNYTGNLTDVFSCLAKAVGVNGCGYEHQLQSVRMALNPQQVNCDRNGQNCTDINIENVGFLRPKAYLAIVLITDEDDCSAPVADTSSESFGNNDSMFLQRPMGEAASLKCAARGHVCNGRPIPNYDPTIGYSGQGFITSFANCAAKDQINPARPDSTYMPLISVQDFVDSVNGVKSRPQDQILVSGIIGWPVNDDPTSVQYQIGVDPTSLPVPQNTYWDYMPICSVPSIRSADGNIYKAYGGLRLKKFIDAFGAHGQHFSICNNDFSPAMTQIGQAIAQVLKPGCVQYPLIDTDPTVAGVQPECQVVDKTLCNTPGLGTCLAEGYQENPLPECIDPTTQLPLDPTNPALTDIPDSARPCWYLYYTMDPVTGCPNAPNGQRITALRRAGTQAPADTLLALTCLTCPASDPGCGVAGH
jgi:hypothetical protein